MEISRRKKRARVCVWRATQQTFVDPLPSPIFYALSKNISLMHRCGRDSIFSIILCYVFMSPVVREHLWIWFCLGSWGRTNFFTWKKPCCIHKGKELDISARLFCQIVSFASSENVYFTAPAFVVQLNEMTVKCFLLLTNPFGDGDADTLRPLLCNRRWNPNYSHGFIH